MCVKGGVVFEKLFQENIHYVNQYKIHRKVLNSHWDANSVSCFLGMLYMNDYMIGAKELGDGYDNFDGQSYGKEL